MIASYKYNFIFIKTPKAASTSLEFALSAICGPDDIIAPTGLDLVRAQTGVTPRNFSRDKDLERQMVEAIRSRKKKQFNALKVQNRMTEGCHSHMSLAEVRAWVPEEFWNSAFKFTSERHPYEKVVSLARMMHTTDRIGLGAPIINGFTETLDWAVRNEAGTYRGYPRYFVDGQSVLTDFILYPSLERDTERICRRLGITPPDLSRQRVRIKDTDLPAARLLSRTQKDFIYEQCKPEFELFGWKR